MLQNLSINVQYTLNGILKHGYTLNYLFVYD